MMIWELVFVINSHEIDMRVRMPNYFYPIRCQNNFIIILDKI